jgi:tetratricopeptide (TPR) repeat protein
VPSATAAQSSGPSRPPASRRDAKRDSGRISRRTPINLDDKRFPRRGPLRFLRTVLIFAWGVVVWYLGRATFDLFSLASSDVRQLTDSGSVLRALLLPGALANPQAPLSLFAAVVTAFVLVLYGSIWATVDSEHERKVLYTREIAAALSRTLPGSMRERLASAGREVGAATRLAEPQGPPVDDVLLPPPEVFVGRTADLEWLENRLRAGGAGSVTAIAGLPGIGKTALVAVAVRAMRVEGRFRDGIAVVLCAGLTDPVEVLRRVLARFDPQRRQPDAVDREGLAEAARRLLVGKEALVVLDNVEPGLDIVQVVGPLRAAGAVLLLDSGQVLPRAATPVEATRMLGLLSGEEAAALFPHMLGVADPDQLTATQRGAVARIVVALGRHTLAVKLAAAYAADLVRDLMALAGELENPQRALALPAGEAPQSVALVFGESINALPPETRRVFTALAAFPTDEFSRNAVLVVGVAAGVATTEGSIYLLVLRELVTASTSDCMPEGSDHERLRVHPLLRAFALSEFARWPAREREAVAHAVASYYAAYVQRTPESVRGPDEANITGALEWAYAHKHPELVAALCAGMQAFWRDRWRTPAALRYLPWGIEAAQTIARKSHQRADRQRAADLALNYAQTLRRTGKLAEAERSFQANLALWRELRDRAGEALVQAQLGYLALSRRQLEEAERSFTQALTLFRETHNPLGEGETLGFLGQIAQYRGQLKEAERYYHDALRVLQGLDDRQSEGRILTRLGKVAQARGDLDEAERAFERALAVERESQNRQDEGETLVAQGGVLLARGQIEAAERHYREGLALLRELGDVFHYAGAALHFGVFFIEQRGAREEGCALLSEAQRLFGEMGLKAAESAVRERARQLGCQV